MEEEDMEVENHVSVAHDVDFDYEFDASRFFDFCVQETASQALQAELWFQTAQSYPPSPFVKKLLLIEGNVNVPSGMAFSHTVSQNDGNGGGGVIQNNAMQPLHVTSTGMTFSSKTINDGLSSKAKSARRKCSTLLKPTASQLAKQNHPTQNVGSRFKKLPAQNKEMNLSLSSVIENQAAKRQKLESGLLHKAGVIKQQTDFFHKAPKMILNAPTLPLPKRSTPRLPAFQEFHLKTSERAMQHTFATSSSSLHCNESDEGFDKHHVVSTQENRTKDFRRPSAGCALKHDRLDFAYNFKARPLGKKILLSKGDIGVFRNRKLETTVPTEFNFHTEKRIQHNPPTDLFSKLSLASEVQPSNGSQLKLPQHSRVFGKVFLL
ncbi:unnamed protein product [Lupinus luteus]|uniref:TPX2 central domain-containing protein n=1 Tax=Lupinus luteus TaxID=3873 RepID=A0AAV1WXY9_LUPLU